MIKTDTLSIRIEKYEMTNEKNWHGIFLSQIDSSLFSLACNSKYCGVLFTEHPSSSKQYTIEQFDENIFIRHCYSHN